MGVSGQPGAPFARLNHVQLWVWALPVDEERPEPITERRARRATDGANLATTPSSPAKAQVMSTLATKRHDMIGLVWWLAIHILCVVTITQLVARYYGWPVCQ